MIPRLYVPDDLAMHHVVALHVSQIHYLCRVMRLRPGDSVALFNGRHGLWHGTLTTYTVHIARQVQQQDPLPCPFVLFFSPIKRQDWLIEKACELGVNHFIPVLCERSSIRYFSLERHKKIIYETCEQSHRLHIPFLSPLRAFGPELLPFTHLSQNVVLDPYASLPLSPMQGPISLWVGPEGGWSPQEITWFDTQALRRVHMGAAILRAETAAIAAVARCITF